MEIANGMAALCLGALSATAASAYQLHEHVVCRRRAAATIPWNWNVGVAAPILPPAQETCR